MDNLIITAQLINPPSETLAFRTVTLFSSAEFHLTNLIEVEKDFVDVYYHYMRKTGAFDFIKEIITPIDREEGIRIDTECIYPLTIVTDRIVFGNTYSILGQLKTLTKF
jgi:hypothetical protein